MNYAQCSSEVVGGLSSLVGAAQCACALNFDDDEHLAASVPQEIDLADVDSLIDTLCVLRPRALETSLFRALMHMIRGQWDEAIQLLYQVVEVRADFYYGKALLAFCLCYKDDAAWRPLAHEVLGQNANVESLRLIQALDAYISVRDGTPRLSPSIPAGTDDSAGPADTVDEARPLGALRA